MIALGGRQCKYRRTKENGAFVFIHSGSELRKRTRTRMRWAITHQQVILYGKTKETKKMLLREQHVPTDRVSHWACSARRVVLFHTKRKRKQRLGPAKKKKEKQKARSVVAATEAAALELWFHRRSVSVAFEIRCRRLPVWPISQVPYEKPHEPRPLLIEQSRKRLLPNHSRFSLSLSRSAISLSVVPSKEAPAASPSRRPLVHGSSDGCLLWWKFCIHQKRFPIFFCWASSEWGNGSRKKEKRLRLVSFESCWPLSMNRRWLWHIIFRLLYTGKKERLGPEEEQQQLGAGRCRSWQARIWSGGRLKRRAELLAIFSGPGCFVIGSVQGPGEKGKKLVWASGGRQSLLFGGRPAVANSLFLPIFPFHFPQFQKRIIVLCSTERIYGRYGSVAT